MSEFEDMINGIRAYCGSGSDVIRLSLVDFATRLNVITSYAFVELPSEVDDLYRIIYDSDLFQTVCNNVNKNQIEAALSFVHGYYGIDVR